MATETYTKGDWKVVHEFNVEVGNHRGIASCGSFTDSKNPEKTRSENIANAHLIAAAPDLYEALKEITELAPRDKLNLPYAVQAVEIADKALAKVKEVNNAKQDEI